MQNCGIVNYIVFHNNCNINKNTAEQLFKLSTF